MDQMLSWGCVELSLAVGIEVFVGTESSSLSQIWMIFSISANLVFTTGKLLEYVSRILAFSALFLQGRTFCLVLTGEVAQKANRLTRSVACT